MKHIKSINEFFDSEEIKSNLEIDLLQGKLSLKDMVKDESFFKQKDLLLSKLLMNCPFIIKLKYNRVNKNLLTLGFDYISDKMYSYFVIEIMENNNSYICNIYAKCINDGKILFNEKVDGRIISYTDLTNLINNEGLNLLIGFSKFTQRTFGYNPFPFQNRNDVNSIEGSTYRN